MFVFLHPITGGALRSPELNTIYYDIEGGWWRREGKRARSLGGKGEGAKKRDVQNVRLILTRRVDGVLCSSPPPPLKVLPIFFFAPPLTIFLTPTKAATQGVGVPIHGFQGFFLPKS